MSERPITAFERRTRATTGRPPPRAFDGQDAPPATDLHAHFAGCPRPETLIEVGLRHDLAVDGALLDEAGLRGWSGPVPLSRLNPAQRARYAAALALPLDRQSTFRDMERAYRLRGPFSRSLAVFPDLLDAVVADYAAQGLRRVELSLGSLTEARWLEAAVSASQRAEARHGLALRFLLGISRHNDPEWDADLLDRVETLSTCRALCGVDWMGHETSSTRAFADRIARVADWAHRHRPGFVIRVHAGENPAFPENVAVAAEAVEGRDVSLRIGHALYGSTDALPALRAANAIVEINLTSNYTLNNIQCTADVPLRRLLDEGIDCVLGTDGPGLYSTSPADELRVARLAGLQDQDVARIRAAEERYLARAASAEAGCVADFAVPPDAPPRHFTAEVAARKSAARADRRAALLDRLSVLGVPALSPADLLRRLGRRAVWVSGAWRLAWANASAQSREAIDTALRELVAGLPSDAVLVTGGTQHGVEGRLHALAHARGLPVYGAAVESTPPEDLDGRLAGASLIAPTPHEKAGPLTELLREADALCLFFGGGNVAHDELRAAANLRLRHLALAGVDGASGAYAARVPHRAFHGAAEALARLDDRAGFRAAYEPFWQTGPNPTVDVVARHRDQILLLRRAPDAAAEPGQWALPGTFVRTHAPRGAPFTFDAETPRQAAHRALAERAGLDLPAAALVEVAQIEQPGRDERDTPLAWSRTWLFRLDLDPEAPVPPVHGVRPGEDARWFPADALPRLAFDHRELVGRVLST